MGNSTSKKTKKETDEISNSDENRNRIIDYDEKLMRQLRHDLYEEAEIFILNNIMFATQFFENFENHMNNLRINQVSLHELLLNEKIGKEKKHCLLPDTLLDSINKQVKFCTPHGPKKFQLESLVPQRMFIVYDDIEVLNKGETKENMDALIHQTELVLGKRNGYVQLKIRDDKENKECKNDTTVTKQTINSKNNSDISNDSNPNPQKLRLFTKSKNKNNSPSYKDFQKTFTFTPTEQALSETKRPSFKPKKKNKTELIKHDNNVAQTAQEIKKPVKSLNGISDTSLPDNCIMSVQVKKIDINESDSEDEGSIIKKLDLFETHYYVNSARFATNFTNIFKSTSELLGFLPESVQNMDIQKGINYCTSDDVSYEIHPAISIPWPEELTLDWTFRERRKVLEPSFQVLYEWPTKNMINKIKTLQSNIIPVNHMIKEKGSELEWSLAFPAAERYLETCMSHSQIRCYLFIITLYKTFMHDETKIGLTLNHIRNLIFWECEKNFITWPEHRLGSKMLKILKNLYKHLSTGLLPDYFVPEKNLLENTPSRYLRISQAKLHNILQWPVTHMLIAVRNLKYTFFPPLNISDLYYILCKNDSIALINPALRTLMKNNEELDASDEDTHENNYKFWENIKNVDKEKKWNKQFRVLTALERKKHNQHLKEIRRDSTESIDLQIIISKQLDTYKRRLLLEFFITQFISIATKCIEYGALDYATLQLNYSKLLAILLGEEPSGELEARSLKIKINELLNKCSTQHMLNEKPMSKQEYVIQYNMDMNKLQMSYNNIITSNIISSTLNNTDNLMVSPKVNFDMTIENTDL